MFLFKTWLPFVWGSWNLVCYFPRPKLLTLCQSCHGLCPGVGLWAHRLGTRARENASSLVWNWILKSLTEFHFRRTSKYVVHNNSCFLIYTFKIVTLSRAIQTNKLNSPYPGNSLEQSAPYPNAAWSPCHWLPIWLISGCYLIYTKDWVILTPYQVCFTTSWCIYLAHLNKCSGMLLWSPSVRRLCSSCIVRCL